MNNIKSKFSFEVSPWFEVFFALQVLTDEDSRIHKTWKENALKRIPSSFQRRFSLLGGSAYLWPMIADTLLDIPLSESLEERLSKFAVLPQVELQSTILLGIFHEPEPVKQLLSGKFDLYQTVTRVSRTKREWLAFLGLYPPKRRSPLFTGLESLLRTPLEFQRIAKTLVETFWERVFKETWELISPKLERSKEEKERLFECCSLDEFARAALLRIEFDQRKGLLKAVRGGYTLPLNNLSRAVLLPSAFNDKRHWTTCEKDPRSVLAYFPYFDPSISLNRIGYLQTEEPEQDPALIFKALGDTTRYAMASLLAKERLTSSDLARTLELSRPTVSHHVHLLREAGLLDEKPQRNTVLLSLRRDVLENLSNLVTRKLFQTNKDTDLKRTRSK